MNTHSKNNSDSLDFQIAQLNIMITEFMMRDHHCYVLTQEICKRLTTICQHVEIIFFPHQQTVYLKMLKVWQVINHSSNNSNRETYGNEVGGVEPKQNNAVKITH